MVVGLTQPLTEMSPRNISCAVKVAGAYGWRPYHLHVPTVLKSGNLNLLEPSEPVQTCNGIALYHVHRRLVLGPILLLDKKLYWTAVGPTQTTGTRTKMPRLRTSGVILPLLPHMPSWRATEHLTQRFIFNRRLHVSSPLSGDGTQWIR